MSTGYITSALDSLANALQIIPQHEYLLQGTILDLHVDHLVQRLRGLCDNMDQGLQTFHDHEICFSLLSTKEGVAPLILRVRRAIDIMDAPYQLRYIGQQEVGDRTRPTLVRNSLDIACTPTVIEYLKELGCNVDFEYTSRGYMFRKGRMKITVAKIFKLGGVPSNPESYTDPIPFTQSYLVELSVLTAGQDGIGKEMVHFAEQLRPLVKLEKIDYKRL
ncbi:mediator of RNA polymerase II transcription subunit 18-like isoform X2 [Bradysia coprophila]|uniref:mediator of RNA polymerase II transcription subunit 18-like isoform X2 n=1 Tax=Bradysia coprophila TaxID=38358 RepID=UPI00187D7150|nr:mediator of RNA polymerase II transcription subunit 18-like isoform X2 [Bradysia coprophila]